MTEIMTREYAQERIPILEKLWETRRSPAALADLAGCYFTLNDPKKAEPLIQYVWERHRDISVGMNYAIILKDLGKHEKSLSVLEQTFCHNPDDSYIRLGYAEGLLRTGFWRQAWEFYDNARPTQQAAAADISLPPEVREWKSEPLGEGHLLLVINEGGIGDRISYARWLPELTKWGTNWVFYPYKELYPFYERIFPREKLIKDGDDIKPTHWTTTFALPARFNAIPASIPKPLPFVADPEHITKFNIPRPDKKPVVGICYDAAEKFQGGRKVRSLSEGQAMRLVCMTGDKVHWVNLQHGTTMPYPVSNIPFQTWEDTAGLIHNLDAVVSVDTGTMHLAGAMNKPMAVLLSGNSCWKFLTKSTKCPWYPSAKLYRNDGYGMEDAINQLVPAIRNGEAW